MGSTRQSRPLDQAGHFNDALLESLSAGVVITNPENRITYVNQRFSEISGYAREELIGQLDGVLFPARYRHPIKQRLTGRLSGKPENWEYEAVSKDGTRSWIALRTIPHRNADGKIAGTVWMINCIDRERRLFLQNECLQEELMARAPSQTLVGRSPAYLKVLEQIKMVASTCANVLIFGEPGTGKELVARAIHAQSSRRHSPFVEVHCASIPAAFFDNELFGHVRNAFPGAGRDRSGRLELADRGSLFLDEPSKIPFEAQGKLLRALQDGQFQKIGDDRPRPIHVRIVTATSRDLQAEAKAGRFRLDLYHRLSVFPIELPPLRECPEDIRPLAEHFLETIARRTGNPVPRLPRAVINQLNGYNWPGNARELSHVIERAMILWRGGELRVELGGPNPDPPTPRTSMEAQDLLQNLSLVSLKQLERDLIARALEESHDRIYGPFGAATRLGLKPTTLAARIQKFGLRVRRPRVPRTQGGGTPTEAGLASWVD